MFKLPTSSLAVIMIPPSTTLVFAILLVAAAASPQGSHIKQSSNTMPVEHAR